MHVRSLPSPRASLRVTPCAVSSFASRRVDLVKLQISVKPSLQSPPPSDPPHHPHPYPSLATMERFAGAADWNLEQSYETKPRFSKKAKKERESNRLPIKTASGIVQRVQAPPSPSTTDSEASDDEADTQKAAELAEELERTKLREKGEEKTPKVPEKQRVLEAKEELARTAAMINEDPEENIGMTKRLRELIDDHNPTIQKLAMVALMAVYKDVIPGYRIRPLTAEEEKVKVSKDVKKLRAFEQGILSGYQVYLQKLMEILRKVRKPDAPPSAPGLAKAAATCACSLLTAVPHFNFRGELLKMIVEVVSVRSVDESFERCRKALEELFRTDEDGNASLEAVQLITKMIKAKKYRIHESVLNTFLHLRLLSELDVKASRDAIDKGGDGENPKKRKKKDREFRTKKARKIAKEDAEIEKEMREADATVSHEEREKKQSETLKLVFVTYFKILRDRPEGLMAPTLEGLAKFAHLINLDFFGDLLVALKELIADSETDAFDPDRDSTRESLLCIITAFTLLHGQGDKMLPVDLTFFTNHLYTTLLPLSLSADIEFSSKSLHLPDPDAAPTDAPRTPNSKVNVSTMAEMLIRALDALFFQQTSATNPLRIAAFTKRLMTSALHVPEKSALAEMGIIQKMGRRHRNRMVGLFSSEEAVGDGVFRPEVEEPERSNPYATTVWESVLLEKHYSPKVQEAAKALGKTFVVQADGTRRGQRR